MQHYRIAPGGRVGGTLTVPGDKSISHRALDARGDRAGGDRRQRLSRRAGLPGNRARPPGARRAHRVARHRPRCASAGWVRAACSAASAPLDMGNAGTAMRLMMGLLAPQRFASTLIGDASLMRRPMERVAAPLRLDGGAYRDARRLAAGADPGDPRAARHRVRAAGCECAGEVRAPAGGARGRRAHASSPSRRPHAITPSACCAPLASSCCSRGRRWRLRADRVSPARPFRCRGISPPRHSSSWPACSRADEPLVLIAMSA